MPLDSRTSTGAARFSRAARVARVLERPMAKVAVVATIAALGAAAALLPAVTRLDLALDDALFALLARLAPRPAPDDIAIVAVDEASLDALGVPQSLLLGALARGVTAIATARPRAIGLDVILPERAYPALAPRDDVAMATALLAARRSVPVVVGITARADGTPRPVLPALLGAATAHGLALFPADVDGRVRRIDDRLGAHGERVPTLVGEIARTLGLPAARGGLHYALGDGFAAVPLATVLRWHARGDVDALERAFHGRVVLVGAVLPYEDRFAQPVALDRADARRDVPGVMVHAQALRSLEANALVRPVPPWAALAFLAGAALPWFPRGPWTRMAALTGVAVAATALAALALRQALDVPLAAALAGALLAAATRSALDAWCAREERLRLAAQFGGYVSPAVLDAILAGRLDDEARRGRRVLAFLFADVRGFVELSARHAPEGVLALLNRYYEAVTPAIHAQGGTIDNFRGDGLMAIFGAPNPLPNPAAAASAAARDMLLRLAWLNEGLERDGLPTLAVGVTLALGEAVVGNVGSRDRYNYTAIGDGANVAARLQEVAKTTGWPVVATSALAEASGATDWTPLGTFPVRGREPVPAAGWRPPAPHGYSS
ncbi:MAG TPA: adenylate/guanylate cyclase domain-containing protein [Casimicrobiaceae bacterium]|nr:adenylate/guanylate cyclase domain-containing protein [Casimicrobiaceae bacterium]